MRQDRLAALSSKETKSVPPKDATALEEVAVTFTAPAPTSFPKQLVLPTGFEDETQALAAKLTGLVASLKSEKLPPTSTLETPEEAPAALLEGSKT